MTNSSAQLLRYLIKWLNHLNQRHCLHRQLRIEAFKIIRELLDKQEKVSKKLLAKIWQCAIETEINRWSANMSKAKKGELLLKHVKVDQCSLYIF